jgi:phenylpyruvate tautomerase PptA (4-oxalocrotonate tautomerase family)
MPILHVRALPQPHPEKIQGALKATCAAIAKVYGCKPQQVWATWEEIRPGLYLEGEVHAAVQPQETHPPIATLTCFEGRTADEVAKLLSTGAKTLSEALGIPGNIFMTYHEAASGRVIAGDGIVGTKS